MKMLGKLRMLLSYVRIWVGTLLFVLPALLVVMLPLSVYEGIVKWLARRYRKDLKSRLTAYDSIFAVDKFYSQPYAGNVTLLFVEGYLDIARVRECFQGGVLEARNIGGSGGGGLKFERLLQIPESFGGYYFWKDIKSLELSRHVRKVHDFALEDDFPEHEGKLYEILGDLMTTGFPVQQGPLWELLLLNGYKNNQSVLVFRMHHTLGDGYTFNHLIDHMINQKSKYLVKQAVRSWGDEGRLLANGPGLLGTLYKEGLASKRNFYTKRKVSSRGVVSMTSLDLETMKEIRRVTKTHFATVGMSLMCGALRRYFMEQQESSRNKRDEELPPWVSVMHSLPKPNHPLTRMVNHWGVGLFKIPIGIGSPLERLRKAEEGFKEYMDRQFDQLLHVHMPLMALLPRFVLELFFSTNFGTSMGFTSVPAFEGQAYLWGYKVLHMTKIFGLQWKQTAVATAVYTHNGRVGYTMFANRDIIPDQKSIDRVVKTYLHQEFDELARQTGVVNKLSSSGVFKSAQRLEPFA